MKWQDVKQKFIDEYNKKNDDFLLFDLAHANENAHTRVLLKLLNYNNHYFLPSFLKQIGLPDCLDLKYNSILISDQEPAIPESTTKSASGYIDLYLRYQDKDCRFVYVIIENKICGAGDTKQQLARYVATVEKGKNTTQFNFWYIKPEITKNIHVVYLTADGTKEPNEGQKEDNYSLPKVLEDELDYRYHKRNYRDDILPWLEETVMPEIPYSSDGMIIAGVLQYITYLKKMFITETTSKCLKEYYEGLENNGNYNPVDLYKTIDKKIKEIEEEIQKDDKKKKNERENPNYDALKQLANNLEYYKRKKIFRDYTPKNCKDDKDNWELYFTPSFILLYKDSWWSENDKKKNYNFPSIHMFCSPTDNFIKKERTISWCIKGVRIPNSRIIDGKTEYNEWKLKDEWKLKGTDLVKVLLNKDNAKGCGKNYFKNIVNNKKIKKTIDEIDKMITIAEKNKSYQEALMEKVMEEK